MLRMKKLIAISSCTLIALFISMTTVFAYSGTWTSFVGYDVNGYSEVGTTYAGGANPSEVVDLYVRRHSDTAIIGWKSVGCKVDQKVRHKCWGSPFENRYGIVGIDDAANHVPFFDE